MTIENSSQHIRGVDFEDQKHERRFNKDKVSFVNSAVDDRAVNQAWPGDLSISKGARTASLPLGSKVILPDR